MMERRDLAYWKGRKVELRNILAGMDRTSGYYGEMQQAYIYTCRKVLMFEKLVLV